MDYKKRELSMIAKYGSEEALRAKRQEWQKKSRINYDDSKRQATLGAEKRSEVARKAAQARWRKNSQNNSER